MFESPSTEPTQSPYAQTSQQDEFDEHICLIQPNALVKGGCISLISAAALLLATALQLLMLRRHGTMLALMPWVFLAATVLLCAITMKLYRMRGGAPIAGIVAAAIVLIGEGVWLVVAVGSGFFSLIALLAPFGAITAIVFCALSVGPVHRAVKARLWLKQHGLEMDLY